MEENKFNILLRKELACKNPNEVVIRNLVKQGAEITGEFLIDTIFCFTNSDRTESLDTRYLKLLLELGADVNHTDDGFNCLFEASLSWNPELVQLFIDAGANVNCINIETNKSILDAIELVRDQEKQMGRGGEKPLSLILDILKQHGAKRSAEMDTTISQIAKDTLIKIKHDKNCFSLN